jgi:hypothetical protein
MEGIGHVLELLKEMTGLYRTCPRVAIGKDWIVELTV